MKFALYGNDIDDQHTAYEASLGLDRQDGQGRRLYGRAALEKQKKEGVPRKLVGFTMTDKGIPGSTTPSQGRQEGGRGDRGTMSPSLKIPIGVGYVPTALAAEGSTFEVEIRGKPVGPWCADAVLREEEVTAGAGSGGQVGDSQQSTVDSLGFAQTPGPKDLESL
jgi:aminomethyltransferase